MKIEIRALEYAVAALVAKLEVLLRAEFGLNILEAANGLHVTTPDHLDGSEDAFAQIRPRGWPKESCIHARFLRGWKGWELYEGGEIRAPHLSLPFSYISFKSTNEGLGLRFDTDTDYQRHYVANGYRQLIGSLTKDAKEHQQ